MRGKIFPVCIALCLFILPFIWFKPGMMDLGGDSSRLYFYDPLQYLLHYSLFAVSPSSIGAENIGFMTIPLVLILAVFKTLGASPTVLIDAFHGLSVASAFFFVYLSITQLLRTITRYSKFCEISGVAGGLLYVFSPVSIYGWDKALITHNHIFLNPIIFYLLLKYIHTDRVRYLFLSLVVTFVFSANFSFVAAPVFFAFYPFTLVFMLVYKQWILGTKIHWKQMLSALLVFILLHAFHIVPQIMSMLTPGSIIYTSVFSDEGKFNRGLGYFSAIVPSIKASINVLLLPQVSKVPLTALFVLFVPFTVVMGLLRSYHEERSYRRTLVLAYSIFLVILFFATANITDFGLSVYKKLFVLPGFSIYRNFYGQWASSYIFYYVLMFGISLGLVLQVGKKFRIALGIFIIFLCLNAWPFINGSLINPVLWRSNNSRIAMNIDPVFVNAIEYVHQLPSDGKVLTLPLTDPGYQIIAGKDFGAYQGPSTISYLAGKQDFAGALELGRFSQLFLESVKKNDLQTAKRVLGTLNIKYVFYDSDPRVYDAFPTFPYDDVRKYFPKNQKDYEPFVNSLSLKLLKSFGNRFFIYELPQEIITPRIYIPSRTSAISQIEDVSVFMSLRSGDGTASAYFEGLTKDPMDIRWYPLTAQSTMLRMVKNPNPPRVMHHAFATVPIKSVAYPLIAIKEAWELRKADKAGMLPAIDKRVFFSAKRILELEQWGADMPVLDTIRSLPDLEYAKTLSGQTWNIPQFLNITGWRKLNSWEAVMSKYYLYFDESLRLIESAKESESWKAEQKFLLSEYLRQHHRRIVDVIRIHSSLGDYRDYLFRVTEMVFADLLKRTQTDISDLSVPYVTQLPPKDKEAYELYLDTASLDANELISVSDGTKTFQNSGTVKDRWQRLGTVTRTNADQMVAMQVSSIVSNNLINEKTRMSFEVASINEGGGTLSTDMRYMKNAQGMAWEIDSWQPKSYYFLKFSYKTEGDPFSVRVLESDKKSNSKIVPSTLVDDMLISSGWVEYQAVIRSDVLANTGYIQIVPADNQSSVSRIELKDMSLIRVKNPSLVLVRRNEEGNGETPTISFVQKDPTLYIAHVTGAVKPYYLVLSEVASPHWRLAVMPKRETVRSPWGNAFESLLNFIDRIVPYRRKIIAEDRHYETNVYGNAWYVKPDDVAGKSEYELELYMTTQSYFYVGAGITMCTLVGMSLYVWNIYRRKI